MTYNDFSSKKTIQYLKSKNAWKESNALKIDEIGFWKFNWIISFRNSRSIIHKTKDSKFYLSEDNLDKYGKSIKIQGIVGGIEILSGIILLVAKIASG